MSNAYLNQVLFGYSKDQVNAEYICSLLPQMLTDTRVRMCSSANELVDKEEPADKELADKELADKELADKELVNHPTPQLQEPDSNNIAVSAFQRRKRVQNSLFWAIYDIENPTNEFKTRANLEIEHRIKVVSELKKTPKRLKETNSKLTIDQTQALLGSMLVAKEDKLDFCIAYAVYYNKSILVVYDKTYRVFSPTVETDITDPENVILLYCQKPDKMVVYESEKNLSSSLLNSILETKVMGPLKAMSNYKTPELAEIASKFHIEIHSSEPSNGGKPAKMKARKKEDIYNDIRVAMHIDMNFIPEQAWNSQQN
jgi:hypothetical protein